MPNAAADLRRRTGFFQYKGTRRIIMPQNYIILFKPTPEEEKQKRYMNAADTVREICEVIRRGDALEEKPRSGFEYVCTKIVERWYNKSFTKTKKFHATDACVGCGLCEKNCPTNSIRLTDGKPVWTNKVCVHCMACVCRCPRQAIEYGNKSQKPRHVCPAYHGTPETPKK